MGILTSIWSFIKDPKNRSLMVFIMLGVCLLLFLQQCNKSKDLQNQLEIQKTESIRLMNNEQAKSAELKNYKLNDSSNRGIIQGYQITQKELQSEFKSLVDGFSDLKKQTAMALVKGTIYVKETIYLNAKISTDASGVKHITGYDTMRMDADNFRYIGFDAPFSSKYYSTSDSTEVDLKSLNIFQLATPGKSVIDFKQSIGLKVGIFQDKKDKKIYIAAQSKYPGLTFSKLEGADIMEDPESRKVTRQFRKTWSLGVSVGYGAMADLKTRGFVSGPYIGVGLNYSPKILQWGK